MANISFLRKSKELDILRGALAPIAVKGGHITTTYRFKHNQEDERQNSKHGRNWRTAGMFGISTSIALIGLHATSSRNNVLAEEPDETMKKEIIDQENR